MITRRSIMVFLGLAPVAPAFGLKVTERWGSGDDIIRAPIFPLNPPLRNALASSAREFDPRGGDMGRAHFTLDSDFSFFLEDGEKIHTGGLAEIGAILARMGFHPYVVDASSGDQFGQAFPLYGCSGGITGLLYRVWIREHDGKYECIPIEYVNPIIRKDS